MAEVEIGMGKVGRRAWALEEITVVPSRRTRDAEEVDLTWELEGFSFSAPFLQAPTDAVGGVAAAVAFGRLGGLGVIDLEGLWVRHEDPGAGLAELREMDRFAVARRLRELYDRPVRPELVAARLAELRQAGLPAAGAVSPKRAQELLPVLTAAECDLLVIEGTVVSAEHVTRSREPLNLKRFIREIDLPVVVGRATSYQSALHLMRTGAVGVLVGSAATSGRAESVADPLGVGLPTATAIADAVGARMRHLDETGVYCQVIAAAGIERSAEVVKALACGADAVTLGPPLAAAEEAPGRGWYWERDAIHPQLPRGAPVRVGTIGTLAEIIDGPARVGDGRRNFRGALRMALATCGYESVKEFQKADVAVRGRERAGLVGEEAGR